MHVDKFSNRIIENILNDEDATSTQKTKHSRSNAILVSGISNPADPHIATQGASHHDLYSDNPYGGAPHLQANSQHLSIQHEADLSLSQSFLTAQNQQSQQTPGGLGYTPYNKTIYIGSGTAKAHQQHQSQQQAEAAIL